MFIVQGSKI